MNTGKISGYLQVGRNDAHEIVINLDDMRSNIDENGIGHIVFSPRQARDLARLLIKHAAWAEAERDGKKSPYEGITSGW